MDLLSVTTQQPSQ